jgi:DMSO/TMAO reductase YedYZ molybdopterin-dependent catalytic subunit
VTLFSRGPQVDERLPDGRPRLPPGQRLTDGFPILHYGGMPQIDLAKWEFLIVGLVEEEQRLTWDDFMALPQVDTHHDIHCVTTWSKYDTDWRGVRFSDLLDLVQVKPEARNVMVHSYGGYTTNLPLEDVMRDDVIFGHTFDGKPLDAEHGWPLRLVVPHLYFWKSAKWVRGLEFLAEDRPGFWEMYGYHNYGDPWKEERYG